MSNITTDPMVDSVNYQEVERLERMFGDVKLSEIIKRVLKNRPYVCPKCSGSGKVHKYEDEWSPYDMRIVGTKDIILECDLCDGTGRTVQEYVPKKVVTYDGFVLKNLT